MSRDDRLSMLRRHHQQTLWIYWTVILLGAWTMLAPITLGYLNESPWVDPSGSRGVWFSTETHTSLRAWLMTWSDLISGLLLIVFGWRSLTPNRPVSLWAFCFVGIWLTFAPLFFWALTAASYPERHRRRGAGHRAGHRADHPDPRHAQHDCVHANPSYGGVAGAFSNRRMCLRVRRSAGPTA